MICNILKLICLSCMVFLPRLLVNDCRSRIWHPSCKPHGWSIRLSQSSDMRGLCGSANESVRLRPQAAPEFSEPPRGTFRVCRWSAGGSREHGCAISGAPPTPLRIQRCHPFCILICLRKAGFPGQSESWQGPHVRQSRRAAPVQRALP